MDLESKKVDFVQVAIKWRLSGKTTEKRHWLREITLSQTIVDLVWNRIATLDNELAFPGLGNE